MWPDAISYLIIRVIISFSEMTDDEGKPLPKPRTVTQYRELRPSLCQAHKADWLSLDHERTERSPLTPRFNVEESLLRAWALKEIVGDSIFFGMADALEKGTKPSEDGQVVGLQVVADWKASWKAPDSMLRFAAKKTYRDATKQAILAELARRKAARKAKKAS